MNSDKLKELRQELEVLKELEEVKRYIELVNEIEKEEEKERIFNRSRDIAIRLNEKHMQRVKSK